MCKDNESLRHLVVQANTFLTEHFILGQISPYKNAQKS